MLEMKQDDSEKNLVVIGMDEYKEEINYVDGWITEKTETINEYLFAIERVSGGLRLYMKGTQFDEGFVTVCDSTMERATLQALAALVSNRQMLDVEYNDIMLCSSPIMEFKTKNFAIDSWVPDVKDWFVSLKSEMNPQNVKIISAYGCVDALEASDIFGKLMEDVGDTEQDIHLMSCVSSDTKASYVQISLWLGEQGQRKFKSEREKIQIPSWLRSPGIVT